MALQARFIRRKPSITSVAKMAYMRQTVGRRCGCPWRRRPCPNGAGWTGSASSSTGRVQLIDNIVRGCLQTGSSSYVYCRRPLGCLHRALMSSAMSVRAHVTDVCSMHVVLAVQNSVRDCGIVSSLCGRFLVCTVLNVSSCLPRQALHGPRAGGGGGAVHAGE